MNPTKTIDWLESLPAAFETAHEEGKPILLDFFSPH
jgi:hypothetical protein